MSELSLEQTLKGLYANEIDVSIRSVWDAGWIVELKPADGRVLVKHFDADEFAALVPWLETTGQSLVVRALARRLRDWP
jgi:hypothetical protein